MKIKTNIALFCLVAISAAVVPSHAEGKSAESADTNAKMYSVSEVILTNHPAIKEGVPASTIRMTAGNPYVRLTRDLWMYTQFRPDSDLARSENCDLLLIAFEDNRVSEIYFANDDANEIVRDRIKAGERTHDVVLAAVGPKSTMEVASNQ